MQPLIPYFEVPKIPLPFWPHEIHLFGILVACGFLFGGQMAMSRAKRYGDDPEIINRLITWLVVGTFIGGKLGYGLMYDPESYLADPSQFLNVRGGLSSFGGFIVCIPICIWFFSKEKVPVWRYMDHMAFGMALGWFFGRMGCFTAHDHPGTESTFWLAVPGICPGKPGPSVACHDLGLYESLWSLGMLFLLFGLERIRSWKPGVLVLLFGAAYGPVRFYMDYFRPASTDIRWGAFTAGQYWSGFLFILCAVLLVRRLQSTDAPVMLPKNEPPTPEEPTAT